MNWQIQGHPITNAISRKDSFYSGMAVSLICQSCGLACPQRLISPLYTVYHTVKKTGFKNNLYDLFKIKIQK